MDPHFVTFYGDLCLVPWYQGSTPMPSLDGSYGASMRGRNQGAQHGLWWAVISWTPGLSTASLRLGGQPSPAAQQPSQAALDWPFPGYQKELWILEDSGQRIIQAKQVAWWQGPLVHGRERPH